MQKEGEIFSNKYKKILVVQACLNGKYAMGYYSVIFLGRKGINTIFSINRENQKAQNTLHFSRANIILMTK